MRSSQQPCQVGRADINTHSVEVETETQSLPELPTDTQSAEPSAGAVYSFSEPVSPKGCFRALFP